MGMKTIALTGNDGGTLAKIADIPLIVSSSSTPRIQETHILVGHILCEMVEHQLFFKMTPLREKEQMKRIEPLDLSKVTLTSLKKKRLKVKEASFARRWKTGGRLAVFLDSLPDILAGQDLEKW